MTDQELSDTNAALERSQGNRELAAAELKLPVSDLKNRVHNCPVLWTRWASDREKKILPPELAETIHREMMELGEIKGGQLVDQKTLMALASEERALKRGLDSLKLDEGAVELARSFRSFSRNHYSRMADIVAGGLIRTYLQTIQEIDKLWQEVAKEREIDNERRFTQEEPNYGVPREQFLLNAISTLMAVNNKTYKMLLDAGLTAAIIAQKTAQLNGGDGTMKKAGRPGFVPKQRKAVDV